MFPTANRLGFLAGANGGKELPFEQEHARVVRWGSAGAVLTFPLVEELFDVLAIESLGRGKVLIGL